MTFTKSTRILLACCLTAVHCLRFGALRGVPYLFNYTEGQSWCNPSFECDIMDFICERLGKDEKCELVVFDSLQQRLTDIVDDEVDIVVSRFSVTPERAEIIDFVRPYYYSSGALLYSLPEDKDTFISYQDLKNSSVCMNTGYYVAKTLFDTYEFSIFPSTEQTFFELLNQEFCSAAVTDSVFVLDGLAATNLQPLYETPYAVAISKSPQDFKKTDIQDIMTDLLTRKDGDQSYIQVLENKYLKSEGVPKNSKLSQLSDSITQNDGKYVGQSQEDDIWSAANLENIKSFSGELISVNSTYDKICRDAMDANYDSFLDGTPASDLPSMYADSIAYTAIVSIEDPTQMFQSWTHVHHPVFAVGETSQQVSVDNPQFFSTIKIIQDVYLSDEKNQKQGSYFYVATPFDAKPAVDGTEDEIGIISATRVVKTGLFQVLQEASQDDNLFFQICGVGETRSW